MIWRTLLLILTICGITNFAAALPVEIVDRGERATALVDVKTAEGQAFGSAFCINESGIFVTDGHVVAEATKGQIKIVVHPGEKDEHDGVGHVLGIDYDADIAVLQMDTPGDLRTLTLGNSDTVNPTQDVTAFGYPFGNMISIDRKSYPSVTVNSGKITALRKSKGELALIQIDALVNPGDSGGPVLDNDGKVIGIVESGVPGAGLNFATPIAKLKKMIGQPLVIIDPMMIDYAQRNKQQTITIQVNSLSHNSADYDVSFKIVDAKGLSQTITGKTTSGKSELQVTPTTDTTPIKFNPFDEDDAPGFKFTLTLSQAGKVVSTQEGKLLINPMSLTEAMGHGQHDGAIDPLPADAEETAIIGAQKAPEFRQVNPSEEPAIGVHFKLGETQSFPVAQNISLFYSKPAPQGGQNFTAKQGYVVGGLIVDANSFLTGFQVIFIRSRNGKLDPSDTYKTDWVGKPSSGNTKQLAGNGESVIGLCGRKGVFVRAIGLVIQKDKNAPATQPKN